jgi:SNF2 family DNA or RNA helicase
VASTDVRIELDKDDKRIILRSAYFIGVNDMCKEIPGANWSAKRGIWTFPLNLQTCRMLRVVFTDLLKVGPRLSSWARAAIADEVAMRELGTKHDTDLDRVPTVLPRIAAAMATRTYQRVGAAFLASAPEGGVLLADQPGLGKTIQTLGGIVERGIEDGLHLVACPATAIRIVWEKEVRKWTDFQVFAATGSAVAKHRAIEAALTSSGPAFLIINPETARIRLGRWCQKCKMFQEDFDTPDLHNFHIAEGHKTSPKPYEIKFPELFGVQWNSITVDESHRFLNGIRGANDKTMVAEGLCRLQVKPGDEGLKIALSGTPIKGMPKNFWGVLHWLNKKRYGSKWQWSEQYLQVDEGRYGKKIGSVAPHREEVFYKSLDVIMLRRTKAEVAPDLPAKQIEEHWCEPSAQQLKQYTDMKLNGEAMFGEENIAPTGVLAELTRLKQIATAYQDESGPVMSKSCKWQVITELLEERGVLGADRYDDGNKFVIASQFTKVIDAMESEFAKLKVPVLKITGSVTPKRRLAAQQNFQAVGGPRIMLINTMAGGVAIDLDQQCDELFFMDETYVPDDQEQVEDRIHRVSRIHRVTIHYLYAKGSIDESIANSNINKDEIQKKILDGRRGVQFALRLLKNSTED